MAENDQLNKPTIEVIITLIILAIINAVVKSLPGINADIPGLDMWSLPTIISAIISTIMIVVVWRYGLIISPLLHNRYPKFMELRTIVMDVIYLICLGLAYGAYRGLLGEFMYEFIWIYDIAFLLIGLFLVYILAKTLIKSTDKLSEIISTNVSQATTVSKICKNCHAENPASNKFCDKCGKPLDL